MSTPTDRDFNRRPARLLIAAAAALAACSSAQSKIRNPQSAIPPNIVLIVADDLGYGEIGVQGGDVPTPNIDSLARDGVRFSSGYVTCPVCSPTRAGLLTGRYQQRFGHEFNPGAPDTDNRGFALPPGETLLPERLKALGYDTGMVGKWHLGYGAESAPTRRGFDTYFGFLGGAHPYFTDDPRRGNPLLRGTERVREPDYLTDAFAREAVEFIGRPRGKPFFLYLPFNAVHTPLEATEKRLERFKDIPDPKRRTFAAMLTALDDGVGAVLAKLRELGLEERTLVFFISDNGGPTPTTSSGNGPLRGYKSQVYEGGIRVPFLARWPGRIPSGKVYDPPVISLDIAATAFAQAGLTGPVTPAPDGVDLVPYLTGGKAGDPHDRLFWRFGAPWAIRSGDWKLASADGGAPALYNLREDVGETRDLAAAQPDRVKALQAAHGAWAAELAEPRWGGKRKKEAKPEAAKDGASEDPAPKTGLKQKEKRK